METKSLIFLEKLRLELFRLKNVFDYKIVSLLRVIHQSNYHRTFQKQVPQEDL